MFLTTRRWTGFAMILLAVALGTGFQACYGKLFQMVSANCKCNNLFTGVLTCDFASPPQIPALSETERHEMPGFACCV